MMRLFVQAASERLRSAQCPRRISPIFSPPRFSYRCQTRSLVRLCRATWIHGSAARLALPGAAVEAVAVVMSAVYKDRWMLPGDNHVR